MNSNIDKNMENHGFFRVAAAIPNVKVADCIYNAAQQRYGLKNKGNNIDQTSNKFLT